MVRYKTVDSIFGPISSVKELNIRFQFGFTKHVQVNSLHRV